MSKEYLEETKEFLKKHCLKRCNHNSNESCICKVAICFKEIEKAQEQEKVFGRTSGKSIISLEHHLKTHIDKPFLFICREEYGNKYVVPEKQYLEMQKKLSDYDMINRILKDGIWIECKYPQFKEPCMMKEKVGIYIRGNDIILECYNKTLLLSDYKKTWWFKKDKSE